MTGRQLIKLDERGDSTLAHLSDRWWKHDNTRPVHSLRRQMDQGIIRPIRFLLSLVLLDWIIRPELNPQSSAARFIRAITFMEQTLGPMSQANSRWSSPHELRGAARRVAFTHARDILRIEKSNPGKTAGKLRSGLKSLLWDLNHLTGISVDVDSYVSEAAVAEHDHEVRVEEEIRRNPLAFDRQTLV